MLPFDKKIIMRLVDGHWNVSFRLAEGHTAISRIDMKRVERALRIAHRGHVRRARLDAKVLTQSKVTEESSKSEVAKAT